MGIRKTFLSALLFLIAAAPLTDGFAYQKNLYGGQLVLSAASDPKTFNPIMSNETSSSLVSGILFEGLTFQDPLTMKVKPNLAESWDVSEDGLRWVFHLRHDVKWFDGQPLTADDVVFTFQDVIYNPQIPSSSKDIFTLEGKTFQVKKIDTYTVEFILPDKFAPFLSSMSQSILPKHCLEQSVKEGKFIFHWGIDTNPQNIVGSGPFYLHEYQPGQRMVFKKNPLYWKKSESGDSLPYLDKVIYLIIPDPDARMLKFIDGELDSIGLGGKDFPLLKPLEAKKNFTIYQSGADFGSSFIAFNQNPGSNPLTGKPYMDPVKRSWFENVHFRQAIAQAIDKNKMIEILFNQLGYVQDGPMSPSSGFFYNTKILTHEFNLNKAKESLIRGGFIEREGMFYDQAGNRLEFNLNTSTSSQHSENIQMAYMIRSDLQKLGIKINLMPLEFNTLVNKLMASFDWDAVIIGLTGGVEPHFGKNVWMSSGQLHLWNPRQKKPATAWEERLDLIFNQASRELDENKRKILYDEFQSIAARELPLIYTVLSAKIYAVRNRFGNLKPSPYAGAFHNLEEIYIQDLKL